MNTKNNILVKIFVAVTYVAMVVVNALANILPINGISTGKISDNYLNLFAPAGLTFSIWGLIYLLLGMYTVYQFIPTRDNKNSNREELLKKIGFYFSVSSIANALWIFAWHYDFLAISVLIMGVILFSLIKIADILKREKFLLKDKLLILTPFSVYFGWITVATIANITVLLVSLGWNGFGIADYIWTSVVLLVGMAIGVKRTLSDKNIAYGLVLVWAYAGILFKHVSAAGFAGNYPSIIATTILCIVAFVITLIYVFSKVKIRNK
jgi:hypothetical protein